MKNKGFRVFGLLMLLGSTVVAGEKPAAPPKSAARPSAVARTQTEDSAFALLIESYILIQTRNIEQDYQTRMAAAEKINNLVIQAEVRALAKKERDLRMEQLENMSSSFGGLYANSCPASNNDAPAEVDTQSASKKLETFVAIRPVKKSETGEKTEVVPAREVLFDPAQD
jgi:hypothetical protein